MWHKRFTKGGDINEHEFLLGVSTALTSVRNIERMKK